MRKRFGFAIATAAAVLWTSVAGAAPGHAAPSDSAAERHGWGTPIAAGSDEFNYGSASEPAVPDRNKWWIAGRDVGACWPGHDGNGRRCDKNTRVYGGVLRQVGEANGDSGWIASRFGQRYGRWESRVRSLPTSPSNGRPYHPVLILWPDSNHWPHDGEYDYLENLAPGEDCAEARIHYPGSPAQFEFAQKCGVDLSQWHNIAIEWTPDHVKGFIDGEEWFSFSGGANSTRNVIQSAPSMHQTIQLDNFYGGSMQTAIFEVDWTRAYSLNGTQGATAPAGGQNAAPAPSAPQQNVTPTPPPAPPAEPAPPAAEPQNTDPTPPSAAPAPPAAAPQNTAPARPAAPRNTAPARPAAPTAPAPAEPQPAQPAPAPAAPENVAPAAPAPAPPAAAAPEGAAPAAPAPAAPAAPADEPAPPTPLSEVDPMAPAPAGEPQNAAPAAPPAPARNSTEAAPSRRSSAAPAPERARRVNPGLAQRDRRPRDYQRPQAARLAHLMHRPDAPGDLALRQWSVDRDELRTRARFIFCWAANKPVDRPKDLSHLSPR